MAQKRTKQNQELADQHETPRKPTQNQPLPSEDVILETQPQRAVPFYASRIGIYTAPERGLLFIALYSGMPVEVKPDRTIVSETLIGSFVLDILHAERLLEALQSFLGQVRYMRQSEGGSE